MNREHTFVPGRQSLLAISILIADDCWTWGPLLNSIWFASIKWSGVQVGLNSNFGALCPGAFEGWSCLLLLRGSKKWSSDRPPGNICGTVATHIWDSNCQRSFFCACSGSQVMIMSRNVGFSWLHRVNVTTGSPEFFSTGNASINRKIGRVVLELLW